MVKPGVPGATPYVSRPYWEETQRFATVEGEWMKAKSLVS